MRYAKKEYTIIRQFYAWVGFATILAGTAYGLTAAITNLIAK